MECLNKTAPLDKKNGFLSANAAVAALGGALTAAFGWLGWLVLAWAACMALDWLSGSAAAASRGESVSYTHLRAHETS